MKLDESAFLNTKRNLNEHFVTLWNDDMSEKQKYLDDVYEMIVTAYRDIGGAGVDKEDLLNPHYMWKMVTKNGKVVAVNVYKHGGKQGTARKGICGASNGTVEGKKALYKMWAEDIAQADRNAYIELSGAPEHIQIDKLGATPIPFDIAKLVLEYNGHNDAIPSDDGYHYTRDIHGTPKTKVMVGNVPEYMYKSKDFEKAN